MSSSPNSSSSSSGANGHGHAAGCRFASLHVVKCPVRVVLGTGVISVRQLLMLSRQNVLRLHQSAGEDLRMLVNGVLVARGEVVVVEDSTAIRLTEIARRVPAGDGK